MKESAERKKTRKTRIRWSALSNFFFRYGRVKKPPDQQRQDNSRGRPGVSSRGPGVRWLRLFICCYGLHLPGLPRVSSGCPPGLFCPIPDPQTPQKNTPQTIPQTSPKQTPTTLSSDSCSGFAIFARSKLARTATARVCLRAARVCPRIVIFHYYH